MGSGGEPMTKDGNRLTAKRIEALIRKNEVGRHHDGFGLYFQITKRGSKSWLYRYEHGGKGHMMGLGPLRLYNLKAARKRRDEAERQRRDGVDPLAAKRERRQQAKVTKEKARTFQQVADELQGLRADEWGKVHSSQWRNTFRDYVYPVIGNLPIADIDESLIIKVLAPIWKTKQTAQRVRERISRVFKYAVALKLRPDNPAELSDHLKNLLGKPTMVKRHHTAMPYDDVPKFMEELRAQEGMPARALETTVLTALRTGEVIGAKWEEIDLAKRVWIIPAARMKTGKATATDHDVPLAPRVVEILENLPREDGNEFVFIGVEAGKPIGARAMFSLLRTMRPTLTVHGFRASFRTWAAVKTNFAREVAEHALAHTVGNKVENAYQRDKLSDKRRSLMEAWAGYCTNPEADNVVPFKSGSVS